MGQNSNKAAEITSNLLTLKWKLFFCFWTRRRWLSYCDQKCETNMPNLNSINSLRVSLGIVNKAWTLNHLSVRGRLLQPCVALALRKILAKPRRFVNNQVSAISASQSPNKSSKYSKKPRFFAFESSFSSALSGKRAWINASGCWTCAFCRLCQLEKFRENFFSDLFTQKIKSKPTSGVDSLSWRAARWGATLFVNTKNFRDWDSKIIKTIFQKTTQKARLQRHCLWHDKVKSCVNIRWPKLLHLIILFLLSKHSLGSFFRWLCSQLTVCRKLCVISNRGYRGLPTTCD